MSSPGFENNFSLELRHSDENILLKMFNTDVKKHVSRFVLMLVGHLHHAPCSVGIFTNLPNPIRVASIAF